MVPAERLELNADLTFETAIEQRIRLHDFIVGVNSARPYDTSENSSATIIIINLCQVKRSDSAGLALMVDALRLGRRVNKKILFENIPEQMMSMICFCNLLPLFTQEK